MTIYLDQITDYFPWRRYGTTDRPVQILEQNTRILKEFSHPNQIGKIRHQVREFEIKENRKTKAHSDNERREIVYEQIRRFFLVEEDSEGFTLLKESDEYMEFVNSLNPNLTP